ncbi:Fcf1-domain-containing protein [Polychytrium aggregatum]|uniref:Fcf1-domain-containing protein n=1 Tax=Polychytrium aggregatum TaxID=110093 RepID=UPI0022FEC6BD|nr:Fcf1-domain-containing protein [Polychytrium aggregatum]KAI9197054.1 Fcf1-domain-containing protein [Polychytrium aggregatum]
MKVKRQKTNKKTMTVFTRSYGFREPYQVLVDGNFIKVSLDMRADVRNTLPAVLVGQVKPMTTGCVIAELRSLGEEFMGAVIAAKRFEKRRCTHHQPIPAADCIGEIIGSSNKHKYAVASQDVQLRVQLRKVPGTPLIYIKNSVTILEPPSPETIIHAEQLEKRKNEPLPFEISVRTKTVAEAEPQSETSPTPAKKKKAKGPNPLSQKKKKPKTSAPPSQSNQNVGPVLLGDETAAALEGAAAVVGTKRTRDDDDHASKDDDDHKDGTDDEHQELPSPLTDATESTDKKRRKRRKHKKSKKSGEALDESNGSAGDSSPADA